MALTFVYGNSGNGKSEYMYQKIADMAERAPYQRYFVVVPEQFTMSAQRSLVAHSSSGVILNIDVVSFDRLAYRVFDELGVHRTVMEETGKSLVLRRIVEKNEQDLTLLKRNLTKMGYIGELKSVLSELMQYGISPDDLEEFLGELDEESSLSYKLRDILAIYRAFDSYLGEGYVTAERVLDLLTEVADESALLRDAVIFFDGFTGFTPVQMDLIRHLMHLVSELYVSVTLDVSESLDAPAHMEDLFYMSHKMVNALAGAARDAQFEIADPICLRAGESSRFADNPLLSHLEQNLFRMPGESCELPCRDSLSLYSLLSARDELKFAAARIRCLVREKGYRYRDFAIVCSDVEEYDKYAEEIFASFDIPGFVDKKQSILYHPLTELIRSVMEIAQYDYSYESVFRLLRTGLCDFSPDEVDQLENYCIEKGIRGERKWKKSFVMPCAQHGRLRAGDEARLEELETLNAIRVRFMEQIEAAAAVFCRPGVTVRERTQALYQLLCDLSVEDKLRSETERFLQTGEEVSAAINRQIYKIVIDLLDKMVDLLGDEIILVSDYAEILEAGFSTARVGAIPPDNDCVILGDIERTRLDEIKVLFFLGVNDGMIPKKSQRQSILSQYDRAMLKDHDLELSPGEREQVFLQRFYLYLALTKPSDALCLTCSRMGGDGKAVRPSYLIGVLEELFADLSLTALDSRRMMPMETAKSSVESYITGLTNAVEHEVSPQWKALHSWYLEQDAWKGRIRELFETHFKVYSNHNLEPALAEALYGSVLRMSVTRLERFGTCAFAHFLEYGLKLAKRKEFTFESLDMGTMFHAVMEKYSRRLDVSYNWDTVTEEEREKILDEALEEAVLELPNELLTESASKAYVLERIRRILTCSIWAITEQIKRGDFLPADYEVPFSQSEGTLPGHRTQVVGKVDRVDTCETDDKLYVRVIDYKSSDTTINLANYYYGRQFQLAVYLDAIMEMLRESHPEKEIIPAGILYSHLDEPMVEDAPDEAAIKKKLLDALRPSGMVNSDPDICRRMDRDLKEGEKSDVMPISLKKGGSVSSSGTNAASTEAFGDLMEYVRQYTKEAARKMLEGCIEVNPYRMGKNEGCKHCAYSGVCGFDLRIAGCQYREEADLKDDEAMKRIRDVVQQKADKCSE
ncbi:MAG: helicase-exonuclease AddAB subunit AddB [Lachnospiraceae bacterium]|nr:helicase-exonuclease AddAB subunit AddB [Lachnospiraceae bacterium]